MIFAVAMTFIDQTIVSIAVPNIQRELSLSSTGPTSSHSPRGGHSMSAIPHYVSVDFAYVMCGIMGFAAFAAFAALKRGLQEASPADEAEVIAG